MSCGVNQEPEAKEHNTLSWKAPYMFQSSNSSRQITAGEFAARLLAVNENQELNDKHLRVLKLTREEHPRYILSMLVFTMAQSLISARLSPKPQLAELVEAAHRILLLNLRGGDSLVRIGDHIIDDFELFLLPMVLNVLQQNVSIGNIADRYVSMRALLEACCLMRLDRMQKDLEAVMTGESTTENLQRAFSVYGLRLYSYVNIEVSTPQNELRQELMEWYQARAATFIALAGEYYWAVTDILRNA